MNLASVFRRPPDFVIGGEERPYIRRWWLIPRNRWFNVYLHQILRDDDDRALHDRPWVNCSILLSGGYLEIMPLGRPSESGLRSVRRRPYLPVLRRPTAAHRLVLHRDSWGRPIPCWSLFLTGPNVRTRGFWCPQGWRPWRQFLSARNKGEIGQGCA